MFVDVDCPAALDGRILGIKPLGGTEATLFRIAEGLGKMDGYEVFIAQHNREEEQRIGCVTYIPFRYGVKIGCRPDAIVVLRNYKILGELRKNHAGARLFLWMHCFPGSRWRKAGTLLAASSTTIICVSRFLRERMIEVAGAGVNIVTIYNPVVILAEPTETNPDKLVFFSSPHKGLEEVLERFSEVRKEIPSMELILADPGYWNGPVPEISDGVTRLGALPPAEVQKHVASALCVFYPQRTFAETFGLVFAEANSLGTPVLAHPLGAADEILGAGGDGQVIDCTPENVLETIREWRDSDRPEVSANPGFQLTDVLAEWTTLLGSSNFRSPSEPTADT